MTVFACQLSPARPSSSHWSSGFYCQALYAKVEPIKRRFHATAAHALDGRGGSEPRAMPGRSDRSQRSSRLVSGALAPAVPLFSAVRRQIPVPSSATRAHRGADTGRKAVSRGLTRQTPGRPKRRLQRSQPGAIPRSRRHLDLGRRRRVRKSIGNH